jgi:hypothetical protein
MVRGMGGLTKIPHLGSDYRFMIFLHLAGTLRWWRKPTRVR